MATSVHAKLKVYTTTTNLADLVRHIGKELVEVESLCKGIQDPHYIEAKPSYTFKVSKADFLVSIGAGLEEGWLPLIIRGSRNPQIRYGQKGHFVASDSLDLVEKVEEKVSRSLGDVHPEGNPHFMLSPYRVIKVASALADRLGTIDSKNKDSYSRNFVEFSEAMKAHINGLKDKLRSGLKVVSYHKTLTYFYEDFGVKNFDVLEPKPGVPPSASHIISLTKRMKKEGIDKIIIENYFDDSIARKMKKNLPSIKIKIVPVAVEGNKDVKSLFDLYSLLAIEIGG